MNLENDVRLQGLDEEVIREYSDAFEDGINARKHMIKLMDCPYLNLNLRRYWMMGWCDQDMIYLHEADDDYGV